MHFIADIWSSLVKKSRRPVSIRLSPGCIQGTKLLVYSVTMVDFSCVCGAELYTCCHHGACASSFVFREFVCNVEEMRWRQKKQDVSNSLTQTNQIFPISNWDVDHPITDKLEICKIKRLAQGRSPGRSGIQRFLQRNYISWCIDPEACHKK